MEKDYKQLDEINSYNKDLVKLCDKNGKIKISTKNLGLIIQEATSIVDVNATTNEENLDELANFITDLVIDQQDDEKLQPVETINEFHINEILSKEDNNNEASKDLIMTILKDLPISLLTENVNSAEPIQDTIITSKPTIFGPTVTVAETQGQGRKAISKDGKIEDLDIFNTSSWPNTCK